MPGSEARQRPNAPTAVDCLLRSSIARDCRKLQIADRQLKLEPASPQLPIQTCDPAFESITGRTPKSVHLAEEFVFAEGPVVLNDAKGEGGLLLFCDILVTASVSLNSMD